MDNKIIIRLLTALRRQSNWKVCISASVHMAGLCMVFGEMRSPPPPPPPQTTHPLPRTYSHTHRVSSRAGFSLIFTVWLQSHFFLWRFHLFNELWCMNDLWTCAALYCHSGAETLKINPIHTPQCSKICNICALRKVLDKWLDTSTCWAKLVGAHFSTCGTSARTPQIGWAVVEVGGNIKYLFFCVSRLFQGQNVVVSPVHRFRNFVALFLWHEFARGKFDAKFESRFRLVVPGSCVIRNFC